MCIRWLLFKNEDKETTTKRQRRNSNLQTESANSNKGLITVPPLVVEDYECSSWRGRVQGRINFAGWWQDRSQCVSMAREWWLNDRPRGQYGMAHDDRWKSFSRRYSFLCTDITNVCTQTCIRDELPESSEETRIRGMYAIIRKFLVVYDAREKRSAFAVFAPQERSVSTRKTWLISQTTREKNLKYYAYTCIFLRYIIFHICQGTLIIDRRVLRTAFFYYSKYGDLIYKRKNNFHEWIDYYWY